MCCLLCVPDFAPLNHCDAFGTQDYSLSAGPKLSRKRLSQLLFRVLRVLLGRKTPMRRIPFRALADGPLRHLCRPLSVMYSPIGPARGLRACPMLDIPRSVATTRVALQPQPRLSSLMWLWLLVLLLSSYGFSCCSGFLRCKMQKHSAFYPSRAPSSGPRLRREVHRASVYSSRVNVYAPNSITLPPASPHSMFPDIVPRPRVPASSSPLLPTPHHRAPRPPPTPPLPPSPICIKGRNGEDGRMWYRAEGQDEELRVECGRDSGVRGAAGWNREDNKQLVRYVPSSNTKQRLRWRGHWMQVEFVIGYEDGNGRTTGDSINILLHSCDKAVLG
ncbi:hypothetical protein B0H16DRAFT_1835507 [Mycena metata]|uniref:Uncharacterized protein n=1 Tax=Mycena metata TaxID=1033252 RepID=A0AAD7GL42_9AGAR|nr:hypothetical protein B0H16DRAFT_1835507 [Mycena metata]